MIDSRSTTASEQSAPEYKKERIKWLAEELAVSQDLQGLWLWTQSGQAEGFYRQLGYREFARFDHFPKRHSRIGYRKILG